MRIVSVTENLKEEKRVAITPETTKKYLSLGFEVLLSENYAEHLGIKDDEYSKLGAKILKSEKEIFDPADIIVQVGLLSDDKINFLKENQIYIGTLNPYLNKDKINELVMLMDEQNFLEEVAGPEKCWPGHRKVGTQPGTGKNKGKRVNKCKKIGENEYSYDDDDAFYEDYGVLWFNEDEIVDEAEYGGRKVKLGKPMAGDVKKFKVYVKNPKGNVVKVNFGHGGSSVKGKSMRIRKNNPKARKSFRARHNCDNPGPRHKARYWSCRKW